MTEAIEQATELQAPDESPREVVASYRDSALVLVRDPGEDYASWAEIVCGNEVIGCVYLNDLGMGAGYIPPQADNFWTAHVQTYRTENP